MNMQRNGTGVWFGDGVERVSGVPVGEWLSMPVEASAGVESARRRRKRGEREKAKGGPRGSVPSEELSTLHCVEELFFSWERAAEAVPGAATSLSRDESRVSLTASASSNGLSEALAPHLRPLAWMAVRDAGVLTASEGNEDKGSSAEALPVTQLWAHSTGAVSQLHYDHQHNVLVQVAGTKRIMLLPPDSIPCLHLFPSLHPRARKSQQKNQHRILKKKDQNMDQHMYRYQKGNR